MEFIHYFLLLIFFFSFFPTMYLSKSNMDSWGYLIPYWNIRVIFSLPLWFHLTSSFQSPICRLWSVSSPLFRKQAEAAKGRERDRWTETQHSSHGCFPLGTKIPSAFSTLQSRNSEKQFHVHAIKVWSNISISPHTSQEKSLLFSLTRKSWLWKAFWSHQHLKLSTFKAKYMPTLWPCNSMPSDR